MANLKRGSGRLREMATMQGVHTLIHTMIETGEALAFVNEAMRKHNHNEMLFGEFGSGLHLHLLAHSLGLQWPVYFRTADGVLHKAETVSRLVDDIGRVGQAVVFEVKECSIG